jgi:Ca2+/Na+ antiporter
MRTLAYIVLLSLLTLLAVRMGFHSVVRELSVLETLILLLLLVAIVLTIALRSAERRKSISAKRDADCAEELDLRDLNLMCQRMEERIESLETILLEREARSKNTTQNAGSKANASATTGATECAR